LEKLFKVNNRPLGKNSPNLVTLVLEANRGCKKGAKDGSRKNQFLIFSQIMVCNATEVALADLAARFFLAQNTKTRKIHQNDHKIYPMTIK
jgi:hypothetical protein